MSDRQAWLLEPSAADSVLETAVEEGVFPGAVLIVGGPAGAYHESAVGVLGLAQGSESPNRDLGGVPSGADESVTLATIYDTASLTKALVTVPLVLIAAERGEFRLTDPVATYLPEFATKDDPRRANVTVEDLLRHCSGLPAHRRYFEAFGDRALAGKARQEILRSALQEPLVADPESEAVYSDIGFLVLTALLEKSGGSPFRVLARERWLDPLGVEDADFLPCLADGIAPTGLCPWRGRVIRGEVQDENAFAMGGVAGHAGLFATGLAVERLIESLWAVLAGRSKVLSEASLRQAWGASKVPTSSTWVRGWDTPDPVGSSAGSHVSREAVGHLGFTGTSVWIDLERQVHVILLTNRVHPEPGNAAIRQLRPLLHDAVFANLKPAQSSSADN